MLYQKGYWVAGPDDRQKNLTNLQEYVNYNITVFASTVKGNGPVSDPIFLKQTRMVNSVSCPVPYLTSVLNCCIFPYSPWEI